MVSKTRKMVFLSLLIGIGLTLSYLESIIPSFVPLPGFKIGFSQVAVLLAFLLFSIKEATIVAIGKTFLGALFNGTFLSYIFLISIAGMVLALLFLLISQKLEFSVYGKSIFSAIGHNLGQSIAIGFTLSFSLVIVYSPYLIFVSLGAGFLIGYLCKLLYKPLVNICNKKAVRF